MSYVRNRIQRAKIQKLQLDLFGFCNAKCWYCPVRYIPQPEEGMVNMSLETVEKIFQEFTVEKLREDGIVDPDFSLFLTTHYSEILLYKDLPGLLELARKYRFQTFILSNGMNLTREKTDLIKEYSDVVIHVGLNIPAFEKSLWAKRTGFPEKRFDELMDNLNYAGRQLEHLHKTQSLQIHVNGITDMDFNSGFIKKGPDFASLEIDTDPQTGEHEKQWYLAYRMFPSFTVGKAGLMDRAGMITNLISNQDYMQDRLKTRQIVGCGNWGDRTTEWVHVNSAGDLILCCNDYHFDYKYGNINDSALRDIWLSDAHVETVERAYSEICTKCSSAVVI